MASRKGIGLHLYCHGLGDCHLLELPGPGGSVEWILIDCGIHTSMKGGAGRIQTVVDDVLKKTDGKFRAIVGTHEHWDHISAFHPTAKLFSGVKTVAETWLAWTEDPKNTTAQDLDKFKGGAVHTLRLAQKRMPRNAELAELKLSMGGVIGFMGPGGGRSTAGALTTEKAFSMEGERVRDAREALANLSKSRVYLEPGKVIELTDQVRCYVLAPPRDTKLFGTLDSAALTYNAAAAAPLLVGLKNALEVNAGKRSLEDDPASPFDGDEGLPLSAARENDDPFLGAHYDNESWRTINNDWLMPASELALQLDNRTNNTSLVLAFEIIKSKHVLIFAADAQIGNWKGWQDVVFPEEGTRPKVTGKDLLERAVFYKVGHHGSRNATMSKGGLELMNKLELAFNPTDGDMAKKVQWEDIPAKALNEELVRRTSGRLIEGDKLNKLDLTKFVAGGALGEDVKIQVAKGSQGRPDINCVVCRIV